MSAMAHTTIINKRNAACLHVQRNISPNILSQVPQYRWLRHLLAQVAMQLRFRSRTLWLLGTNWLLPKDKCLHCHLDAPVRLGGFAFGRVDRHEWLARTTINQVAQRLEP